MINGVLNVWKEAGFTSHDVVAKLRGILHQKKIGHTGTLDPDATGVLPVCLGKGTRLCDMLTDHDKTYRAVLLLGTETDTEDTTGTVLETKDTSGLTEDEVQDVVLSFIGDYAQIPPMYSAIKRDGKNLYDLARRGIEVERHPRKVKVHHLELMEFDGETAKIDVRVSKGTYIRVLADDIGRKLGCFAHLESLRRTEVGDLKIADAIPFAVVDDKVKTVEERRALLKGADFLLQTLGSVRLDAVQTERLRNGQRLPVKDTRHGELLRAYGSSGELLGTVKVDARGTLHPHRLIRFVVTENLEKNGEE